MTNHDPRLVCGMLTILSVMPAMAQATDQAVLPPARITVGLDNFAGLPGSLTKDAAKEADRLLKNADVHFIWLDCQSPGHPCAGVRDRPEFLTLRLLPHALPEMPKAALGTTATSANGSSAAVFCDRALALRTHQRPLANILGSAMAHEIVHVLVPAGSHSESGLMRAEWSVQDLRIGSLASAGISKRTAELIRREAVRRNSGSPGDPR